MTEHQVGGGASAGHQRIIAFRLGWFPACVDRTCTHGCGQKFGDYPHLQREDRGIPAEVYADHLVSCLSAPVPART
ncbi:MAG: hypothetical protein U9Q78_02125 [Chloroflexota bacterium]|nr:hypothetical protein [Chloroflexota bacterium]